MSDIFRQNPLKEYLTSYNIPTTLKLYHVDGDCDLREFITSVNNVCEFEFRRGQTYYEFTNEVENILEGKKVLLLEKENPDKLLQEKENTNKLKWFRLAPPAEVAAGSLKLYGEGIARSTFGDQYRVFIQSFGSGARHLPHDSWILYFHDDNQV